MTAQLVTIYAPSGKEEKHTTLNAVDLVRDCGYTFKPGKEYAPTDGLPYADPTTSKLPSRAQEALDSVGTGAEVGSEGNNHLNALAALAGAAQTSEPAPTARPAPAPAAEEAPAAEPVIEAEVEAAAPAAEEAPAPAAEEAAPAPKARQQRAKKGS